jgi:hypothetical protein
VGRTRPDGSVGVVADVGNSVFADGSAAAAVAEGTQAHARSPEGERDELLGEMRYATIRLRAGVDTVIIGSEGLWCALEPLYPSHLCLASLVNGLSCCMHALRQLRRAVLRLACMHVPQCDGAGLG